MRFLRIKILFIRTISKIYLQGLTFPEEVGLAIGGPGNPSHVVIEIHYNNPDRISGKHYDYDELKNSLPHESPESKTCHFVRDL